MASSDRFRFDLEKALATWRHVHGRRRVFLEEDLDELERHLRDHTAHLLARGYGEEAAFQEAVQALGDLDGGEAEYRKVRWGKLRRRGQILSELAWKLDMLKNYLTVALRTMRRHKGYVFLNVAGLAVGLACCLLIALYVLNEFSYDRFHEHADRICRFVEHQETESGTARLATTYGPLARALDGEFPAIAHTVRVIPYPLLVTRGEQKYQEDGFVMADSTFFEVFSFVLAQGNLATALDVPFSVVLTPQTAQKYFGEANPLGQTIQVRADGNVYDFTVTGVLEPLPENTHLRFDLLGSFSSLRTLYSTWVEDPRNWEHPPLYTYALLREGTDPAHIAAQLPAFAEKHMGQRRTETRSLHLEPLTDIRLRSGREAELSPTSDITYVYLFGGIAVLILLIACINFMNLSTARAARRAKEIGMRKTLGARWSQLLIQFLSESTLTAALAMLLALGLVALLLPLFNGVAAASLTMEALTEPAFVLLLTGLVVVVGVVAGSYPAFFLANSRPKWALTGTSPQSTPSAALLRKGLVVFQFGISMVLIVSTLVVYRQLDYVQNQRLGFDKEHVVTIPLRDLENQMDYAPLKARWKQLPGVEYVTASSGMPGLTKGLHDFAVYPEGAAQDSVQMLTLTVDMNYVETYGLEIVQGRDFSEDRPADATSAFLINETAARRLGWDDPVGQRLTIQVWFNGEVQKQGEVIGVVKDFQYTSLHRAYEPILFHVFPNTYYYDYVSVRLRPGDLSGTLSAMAREWAAFNPHRPFEYVFLDERFDALYRTEEVLGQLFGLFSVLAIVVACLGLFGLAAFTAEQRTKEIGIRKVLGATVPGLVVLLSKEFVVLVSVAFVVAAPVAYVLMSQWLAGFVARVSVGGGTLVLAGMLALLIALLTVSYQSIKAALADPVKSLRYE